MPWAWCSASTAIAFWRGIAGIEEPLLAPDPVAELLVTAPWRQALALARRMPRQAGALLWPVDEQKDQAAFNVFLLKAQKLVPLSNFGITTVANRDYYEIFGEISCKTTLQTVIIELRMLAENAIRAAEELRENFASAA